MKKLIMLLLMLATMATSSKAEDLDSMYTQEMLPIGTEVPDVYAWQICGIAFLGFMVP